MLKIIFNLGLWDANFKKIVFLLDFRKRQTDGKAAPNIGQKKLRYQRTYPIQFAD
jgi:hypothetical protein